MGALLALAVELVTVHMIDGRVVQINPQEIVRMHVGFTDDSPNKVLAEGVKCVIAFTDGQFLSVSETCAEVRALMERKP